MVVVSSFLWHVLSIPLSNFPDSDFHRRRQERPVMQDPAATYIEAKIGHEAVLPCFALGTPTPITRLVHLLKSYYVVDPIYIC